MTIPYIIFLVVSAVGILLFLIIKLKINAFISLLIASIYVGILAGMPLSEIPESITKGMGGTLGFVACVDCEFGNIVAEAICNNNGEYPLLQPRCGCGCIPIVYPRRQAPGVCDRGESATTEWLKKLENHN